MNCRLVPLFPAMNCREANQSWEGTLKNNIPEWRRILRAEKSPYETNRSEQTFDDIDPVEFLNSDGREATRGINHRPEEEVFGTHRR